MKIKKRSKKKYEIATIQGGVLKLPHKSHTLRKIVGLSINSINLLHLEGIKGSVNNHLQILGHIPHFHGKDVEAYIDW